MPHQTVGDIDIYFERSGAGAPLLFISGTGSDLRAKPNVFDGPLAKRFDVLAYDHRGLGRTTKPDRPYSMAQYGDEAAGLMDKIGWESALVVGVSFGGMVAQELVLRHPDKVRRLVLACTSPGGAGGASFAFHELAHLDPLSRARALIGVSDVRLDEAWASAHTQEFEALVTLSANDPYADEPGHAMGARRQLETRSHHDTWDRLPQIACPVLIAAGRYDGIALPQTQANLASQIRGSKLQFFEGGHAFLLQDKTAIPALISFLSAEGQN